MDERRRRGVGAECEAFAGAEIRFAIADSGFRFVRGATVRRSEHKDWRKSAGRPMRMGVEIAAGLKKLYPDKGDLAKTITLLGHAATVGEMRIGGPPEKIVA